MSTQSSAQSTHPAWTIENIHGPSQVGIVDSHPVDFNQDGLMDVVSASIEDGHLRAYINQGSLQFTETYISTELPGVFRIEPVHFQTTNGSDGRIDFLATSIETHEVMLLLPDNENNYQKHTVASDILLPTDARSGQFNADNLTDVISTSFELNQVLLHTQNPDQSFTTTILAEKILRPRKIETLDYNLDGLTDFLVASSEDNSLRLFEQQADHSFQIHLISDQIAGAHNITTCHLNADQRPDFFVSANGSDQIWQFINDGPNSFSIDTLNDTVLGVSGIHCIDTNAQTPPVLYSISSTISTIFRHDLTGQTNKQTVASNRDGYISLKTGQFEPSQPPLLLTQSHFEQRNLFYQTHGAHNETVVWEDFPDGASDLDTGDLNQDGTIDLVLASFRDDRIQWYDGKTGSHHIIAEGIDGPNDVHVVDLDNDGFLDVLSAASFGNAFYWHRQVAKHNFITHVIDDDALFANGIISADIDGDGQLDVVSTSGSDDAVKYYKRNINQFDVHLITNQGDAPTDLVASDVNADGLIDLIVANLFSNDVFILINESNEVFSLELIIENLIRPHEILAQNDDSAINQAFSVSESDGNAVLLFTNQTDDNTILFEQSVLTNTVNSPRNISMSPDGGLYIESPQDNIITRLRGSDNQIIADFGHNHRTSDLKAPLWTTPGLYFSSMTHSQAGLLREESLFYDGFE